MIIVIDLHYLGHLVIQLGGWEKHLVLFVMLDITTVVIGQKWLLKNGFQFQGLREEEQTVPNKPTVKRKSTPEPKEYMLTANKVFNNILSLQYIK